MKKRPGVMLYFDRLTFLDQLSAEQTGTLFKAIVAYARDGVEPETADDLVKLAWEFVRPGLDQDEKRYQEVCEKRKKAIEKRWEAERTFVFK